MEIKRTTEIIVETERRVIVRQQPAQTEQVFCPNCGASMLSAEQVAVVFGVSQRRIFQLIETGAADFFETENGVMLICPSSLAETMEIDAKQLPADET